MNYKQFQVTPVSRYIQLDNQYTAYGKVQTTHIGHNINSSIHQNKKQPCQCPYPLLPNTDAHQCPYPLLPNMDASVSDPTPFYPTWMPLSVTLPSFTQHGCICQCPYPLLPNMDASVSAPTLFYPTWMHLSVSQPSFTQHGCICQ